MEDWVILLTYLQTLWNLIEQKSERKRILVVWMEGDIFHSHGCRNQSLVVASISDTALVEVALYRICHTDAKIVLIRRACYLIRYLELAYFIVL